MLTSQNQKKSLGTLKVFGLDNKSIVLIYSFISTTMIIISFILSYLVSEIIGYMMVEYADKLIQIDGLNEISYQNIHIKFLIFAYVLLPSVVIIFKLRSKLIDKTPGDLIYGR